MRKWLIRDGGWELAVTISRLLPPPGEQNTPLKCFNLAHLMWFLTCFTPCQAVHTLNGTYRQLITRSLSHTHTHTRARSYTHTHTLIKERGLKMNNDISHACWSQQKRPVFSQFSQSPAVFPASPGGAGLPTRVEGWVFLVHTCCSGTQ